MPPKRKAAIEPQTICPITKLPIDGNLKKRLKASPAVTEKTIQKVMANILGIPAPTGERDEIIEAYADALAKQKPSAVPASPPAPAPARTASSKSAGNRRVSSKAVVAPPSPSPSPEKAVTPAPSAIVRQRSGTTSRTSKVLSPPVQDVPSPRAPASPAYQDDSPSPLKKNSKTKVSSKAGERTKASGTVAAVKFIVWLLLVAGLFFVLLIYAGPRVKGVLPLGIAAQADKAHASALVLTRTASVKTTETFNWISVETTKWVSSLQSMVAGSPASPPPKETPKQGKKSDKKEKQPQAAQQQPKSAPKPPPPPPPAEPEASHGHTHDVHAHEHEHAGNSHEHVHAEPVEGGEAALDGQKKKKKKSKKKLATENGEGTGVASSEEEYPIQPLSKIACSDFSFFDCTGVHDYAKCEAKRDACKAASE